MNVLKGTFAVAALAAAAVAASAGSASAAISPDPYSTTVGTGSVTITTPLGVSTCALTNVAATGRGTAVGADLSITGFAARCTGIIVSMRWNKLSTISINRGTAATTLTFLITNIFGGQCLYTSALTGPFLNGGNSLTSTGNYILFRTLAGICENPYSGRLQLTFPSARISW